MPRPVGACPRAESLSSSNVILMRLREGDPENPLDSSPGTLLAALVRNNANHGIICLLVERIIGNSEHIHTYPLFWEILSPYQGISRKRARLMEVELIEDENISRCHTDELE